MTDRPAFTVRTMTHADVPACVDIINHTIALGGTTAHEDPFTTQTFTSYCCDDPDAANVACLEDRLVGFQAVFLAEPGVYSIGSFTDQRDPVRGVGAALFEKTRADCVKLGGTSIMAKITSDNLSGLAYYTKMGFVDDAIWPADVTRKNGTTVDRIVKRYPLK